MVYFLSMQEMVP